SINVGNSCLDVELVRIEPDPVSPPPLPLPIPSQEIDGVFLPVQVQVIRVHCSLASTLAPGTLTFRLRQEMKDSRSNPLGRPYTLLINLP
ncbi:MAG: hypothetical protein SNJ78_10670, partial [Spirochaetales bacterium]